MRRHFQMTIVLFIHVFINLTTLTNYQCQIIFNENMIQILAKSAALNRPEFTTASRLVMAAGCSFVAG